MYYNYLKLNYWFNFRPEPLPYWLQILMIIIVALWIIAYYYGFKLSLRKGFGAYGKFIKRAQLFLLTNAIILLFLTGFSNQMIPILAARFWLILWLFSIIIWKICLYKNYLNLRNKLKLSNKSSLINRQYLPKKG